MVRKGVITALYFTMAWFHHSYISKELNIFLKSTFWVQKEIWLLFLRLIFSFCHCVNITRTLQKIKIDNLCREVLRSTSCRSRRLKVRKNVPSQRFLPTESVNWSKSIRSLLQFILLFSILLGRLEFCQATG